MLVQLSAFKTVKTLLKIPSSSRRRKRNETDAFDVPADVSFVTTSSRRGQHKWKQHSPEIIDSQPLLLVSSDHEISIIGRSKEHSYDEFSSLRYSSRPGTAGSFAPSGKSTDKLPRIPPVLDAKNDMMYVLQNENSRLCCWDSLTVQGPDETRASKVDLLKPAVSMELLPLHKGAIFGTCIDGSIFIARRDHNVDGQDELVVEYLPNKLTKGKHTHASTIAELPQGTAHGGSRKRKMSDAEGHTTVYFYQIFHDGYSMNLVRHEVLFERYSSAGGKMIAEKSLEQRVVNIPLVHDAGHGLLEVQIMLSSPGNALNACVTYRVQTGEDTIGKWFSALFSLTTGQLTHNRVELPSETRQCGLIGDSLLAIGTEKTVQVFDIETGSVLHTTSLPVELRSRQDWRMYANSKIGGVVVLYAERDTICIAVSSLMLHDVYATLAKRKLPLASKLTSARIYADTPAQTRPTVIMYNALKLQISDSSGKRSLEQTVHKALISLDEARMNILSPSSGNLENYLFMDTYEGSVNTVLEAVKAVESLSDGSPRNPQDDDSGGTGKNGDAASVMKKAKNGLNGVHSPIPHTKALTPSLLPQAFVDGATHIVLKLLQCGKVDDDVVGRRVSLARLDARIILHQLLNTGKLSARFHFDSAESIHTSEEEHQLTSILRSIKLSNKRGRRCFSPVDMIMTMLRRCPDVSERQMVVMLSYTMRRALPEDIAEMFMDERKHCLHNQNADLARSFFSLRSNLYKSRKENETMKSPELDRLGRKLILAGTTYVLYGIVGYSQCNEAMLRVAIQDGIEKSEAIILARCLSNIFASNKKKDLISKAPPSVNAVKSLCQWVAALSDSFHDELAAASADMNGATSHLAALLVAINLSIRQSQEIISLKEDVRRVESEIQHQIDAKDQSFGRPLPNPEDLPGYSVAKLIF